MNARHARATLAALKKLYPEPRHYLDFDGPLELLVATILSAQCTDDKVNEVTPALFRRFPDARAFAGAPAAEIEEAVRPTGFYRNKAASIRGACRMIVEEHGGTVPGTMEELLRLPGIARKSANAILQHGFDTVVGVVVDTHVIRLARRLGWTAETNPDRIEADLASLFPKSDWRWLSFYLKSHGRAVCTARRPDCGACAVRGRCPSAATGGAPPAAATGGRDRAKAKRKTARTATRAARAKRAGGRTR
ncbi:MAG: endonuclease III [Candidatus Krumholzibacteriota bacterium]|nr:endonuclease III [Candidatus Krumholzibacteriota bacterium]